MNGHERRKQRIIDRIKKCALELFAEYGADKVTMDEIAARANVSKMTIYKYFGSKEDLRRDVFSLYFDEILAATEQILDSDLDFMEKLRIALGARTIFPRVVDNQAFFESLENDDQTGSGSEGGARDRIKAIMYRFYEQGKKDGYIKDSVSFEMLYLYYEIMQAGFKAKSIEFAAVLADPTALDQLMDLYYFGFVHRK